MRQDIVVIVHGLWMHGAVFSLMRARLHRCGFDARTFSYASIRRPWEHHVRALAKLVDSLPGRRVHLIGHSLGGILCLHYASSHPDRRLSRVLLLGSPVQGSKVAQRLAQSAIGRRSLGTACETLVKGASSLPINDLQIGVIAGNMAFGLGRLFAALSSPHDGTVSVAETQLTGVLDSVQLPVTHTGFLFSSKVVQQCVEFLEHGRFLRMSSA